MQRLFIPIKHIKDNKIELTQKEQMHYLKDVLRLRTNDKLVIFDSKANEYLVKISQITAKEIILIIEKKLIRDLSCERRVTIACAIPKKAKMDEIIDKLTQLGVDKIIPLNSDRTIVKLSKHKQDLKLNRWKKKAVNASQQSQRKTIPIIEPVKDFKQLIKDSGGFDLKLIPTLSGERRALKEIITDSKAKNILVVIGPEGDFTEEEVSLATKAGFIPLTLGDYVLRVDTAAIAIASLLTLYRLPI